jgi:hypothetical protein
VSELTMASWAVPQVITAFARCVAMGVAIAEYGGRASEAGAALGEWVSSEDVVQIVNRLGGARMVEDVLADVVRLYEERRGVCS